MKFSSFFKIFFLPIGALFLSSQALPHEAHSAPTQPKGILILAHGSHSHSKNKTLSFGKWERSVLKLAGNLGSSQPIEVAFGMWAHESFQEAIDLLASEGIDDLTVIPLYVSSHSPLHLIQKYQFGLIPFQPDFARFQQVKIPPSIHSMRFTGALDDSPELSEILSDHAQSLSKNPQTEEIILVAHGPVSDSDDALWLKDLRKHAQKIEELAAQAGRPFAGTHFQTLRDDAPEPIQDQMTQKLRQTVSEILFRGRTPLIVPVLLAPGGIEAGLLSRLNGLSYRYEGKMLIEHPEMIHWLTRMSQKQGL